MHYTPASEVKYRIQHLQQKIEELQLDGALIVHHTNLFYFSGTSQNAHLFVPRIGKPILMVRKSYERALKETSIEDCLELTNLKGAPDILTEKGYNVKKIGMELDVIPYAIWQKYQKILSASFIDISETIKHIRMIKTEYEIDLMLTSCRVIDEAFKEVPSMLQEGMSEIELASLFEAAMRRRGYSGCSKMRAFNQDFFMGNITSGDSGAVPSYFDGPVSGRGLTPANNPHGAGWKVIQRNEPVYIDYTCVVNGYTADATRMFVIGELAHHLLRAYEVAVKIQQQLLAFIQPGISAEAVYFKSLELAQYYHLEDYFMGMGKDKVRFIGHGVGLELDEFPIFAQGMKMPLQEGMIFALEPKFVFPDGAVGIENTHLLTATGLRTLTHASQELIVL